jgi:hypothetical protein
MPAEHYLLVGRYKGQPLSAVPTRDLHWAVWHLKLSWGLFTAAREELLNRGIAAVQLPPPRQRRLLSCRHCGNSRLRIYWQQTSNGEKRIRGDCHRCGRFVGWVPWTPATIATADANTSPTAMLDALAKADEEGVQVVVGYGLVTLIPHGKALPELQRLVRQAAAQLLRHCR